MIVEGSPEPRFWAPAIPRECTEYFEALQQEAMVVKGLIENRSNGGIIIGNKDGFGGAHASLCSLVVSEFGA